MSSNNNTSKSNSGGGSKSGGNDGSKMTSSDASRVQSTQAKGGNDTGSGSFAARAQSAGTRNDNANTDAGKK
ncbi:hypothetical protein EJ08DRAFT_699878 [Tothia fuscella]|uniref:SMP domain-containing protein n=1 Tax=Tothia fuscella TaxID=1048955 RepID=A0A9P4NL67_9PEZI|nr:hypothetical protein EJ08DRAFT_699878 [Tothia fuscella]